VPDEFLAMMSAAAGTAIEKLWRDILISHLVEVAKIWVTMLGDKDGLLGIEILNAELLAAAAASDDAFVLPLSDARGGIRITCKAGALADGKSLRLALEMTKALLPQSVAHIEGMKIGEPVPDWLQLGDDAASDAKEDAVAVAQMILPRKLLQQCKSDLAQLDPKTSIAELRSYNSPPKVVYQVCCGVLCLFGKKRKELPDWKDVRPHLKDELIKQMQAFNPCKKGKKAPWGESRAAVKGLNSEDLLKKGSLPVQLFMKWLEVCHLTRKIAVMLRKEGADEAHTEE